MDFPTLSDRIEVNVADFATLSDEVTQRFRAGQGFALATLNLDHLVKLNHDPDFVTAYRRQDLIVADGNPVVWLARLAGHALELMPGSDMVLPLARLAAREQMPIALIGSTEEALESAAREIEAQVPGSRVVACIAPPFGFDPNSDDADAVLKQAEAAGARLCFLALGAPKQERLAARGRALTPNMGFASVGAGVDFIAGTQTRAPVWARAIAMEWLWRLATNPRRLARRYANCFSILPSLAMDALHQRHHQRESAPI